MEVKSWQTEDKAGEFEALVPSDLSEVAVTAQALDNQWVSRTLLNTMIDHPLADGLQGVSDQRHPQVRTEYMRSLINADQVLANRAYMYNTSAISQDFKLTPTGESPASREAFKTLLSEGLIIP